MVDRVFVRKIQDNLWQWREVGADSQWLSDEFYTGDINLLKESVAGKLVSLVVPGENIVSQTLAADIKDRRQLIKTLPYELEEEIIDSVDDVHFAFGPVENNTITTAYSNAEYLQSCIDEIVALGADVQHCSADYLELQCEEDNWSLLLEGDTLLVRNGPRLGFAVEQANAKLYINALTKEDQPSNIQLIAEDDQTLRTLSALLPDSINNNSHLNIQSGHGCFWDYVNPNTIPSLDFRTGRLARQLPFTKWWSDWQAPIIAIAATFVFAVTITWVAQLRLQSQQKNIVAQTDNIFRQVVPKGSITNPERQLNSLLGKSGGTAKPSNAVKLLTAVAPAIKQHNDVVIRNFRYNADNGQLQMNIEAQSFTTFETLRSKIAEFGYTVEIKSANNSGSVHQAQIRVTEKS